MKTTGDILDKVFPIVNVSSVKGTLDGRVYRRNKPLNSQLRDIEIICQPIDNGEGVDVQSAIVIINCFAKNRQDGTPDETNLKAMSAAVITVIEAASSASSYFEIQITSETIMQDLDDPLMSYASIRVNCTIEN